VRVFHTPLLTNLGSRNMSKQVKACYIFFTMFFGSALLLAISGKTVLGGLSLTISALMAYVGILNPGAIKEINLGKDKGIKIFSPEEREKVLQTSKDELNPELKKELEKLAEDARSREENQRAPEDYLALANEAYEKSKCSDVLAFSLAGLQLAPTDKRTKSTLIYRLGTGYDDLGEVSLAKRLYQESIKEKPDLPFPHNGLGKLYYSQDKPEEAEIHLKQAIFLDPNYAHPHNNLGNVYLSQGKQIEAEECYKKTSHSIPMTPVHTTAWATFISSRTN